MAQGENVTEASPRLRAELVVGRHRLAGLALDEPVEQLVEVHHRLHLFLDQALLLHLLLDQLQHGRVLPGLGVLDDVPS